MDKGWGDLYLTHTQTISHERSQVNREKPVSMKELEQKYSEEDSIFKTTLNTFAVLICMFQA